MASRVGCALLLPLVAAGIRIFGFQRTGSFLARAGAGRSAVDGSAQGRWRRARQVQRTVEAGARYGPYPARCLERALLAWWLLRRCGIESRLRLGVRKQGEGLCAHAWIELDGRPLETRPAGAPGHDPFDRDFAPGNPGA